MKRREFFTSMVAAGVAGPVVAAQAPGPNPALGLGHIQRHGSHDLRDGPLANATVSFGQWRQGTDRIATNPPPPPANAHGVFPHVATIKAGGAVNFIIAGLHQIVVYGPGKRLEDVNIDPTTFLPDTNPAPPDFPPLLNDPDLRVYQGPDPRLLFPTVDRVEVVHFPNPGLHLVICGVVPHFVNDQMSGWVQVLP